MGIIDANTVNGLTGFVNALISTNNASVNNYIIENNVSVNNWIDENNVSVTNAIASGAETDPKWLANYTNQIKDPCSPNFVAGIFPNGTFICATASATDASWVANWTAYNDSWTLNQGQNDSINNWIDDNNNSVTNTIGSHSVAASRVTTGTFGAGNYVMADNLTLQTIKFEADATNHIIYDNATCIFIEGDTSTLRIC